MYGCIVIYVFLSDESLFALLPHDVIVYNRLTTCSPWFLGGKTSVRKDPAVLCDQLFGHCRLRLIAPFDKM